MSRSVDSSLWLYSNEDAKEPCWLFKPHQQSTALLAEFSCPLRSWKYAKLFCPLSAQPLAHSCGHDCLPSPLATC